MKNIITVVTGLLLLYPKVSFCQSLDINQANLKLQNVAATLQSALTLADTGEGNRADQLTYFKTFWGSRVYSNAPTVTDSTGSNMFVQYYRALTNAINARITSGSSSSCGGSSFEGNWQVFGPDSMPGFQAMGKINAVWASPTNSNYILAGAGGGLFKTTNGGATGGATWQCITDNAMIAGGVIGVGSIAVNPLNSDTIFLGTSLMDEEGLATWITNFGSGFGAGILESFDGGNTWSQEFINSGDVVEGVNHVYFTPNADRVYAFMGSTIYTRSNHPVGPWQQINPPTGVNWANQWTCLQFDPSNQQHFYVSNISGKGYGGAYYNAGIFSSDTAVPSSSDWTEISLTQPPITVSGSTLADTDYFRFAISIPTHDTLYAAGMSIFDVHTTVLLKYNISGTTPAWSQWATMPHSYNPSQLKLQLIVSPANSANIYFGGDELFQSGDYGNHFTEIGAYNVSNNHSDVRDMCLRTADTLADSGREDILFVANDGGVGIKPSGVNAVAAGISAMVDVSGHGLATGEFWGLGISNDGRLMLGGEMHDGMMTYEQKQTTPWIDIFVCDGGIADFDNINNSGIIYYGGSPDIIEPYGTRQLGAYGNDGNVSTLVDNPEGYAYPRVYTDPAGNQYAGFHSLWELSYDSSSWVNYGSLPGVGLSDTDGSYIRDMVFSPYSNNLTGYVLYYPQGINQHLEYRNEPATGSPNFQFISAVPDAPDSINMSCITMDPFHPQKVWVGTNGAASGSQQVFYSPNGGSNWYNVSNGLPPNLPLSNIIYEEGSTDVVFCATDAGIYRCDFSTFNSSATNFGIQWTCFNSNGSGSTGFPNVFVTAMKMNYCQQKLYVSTFGRSIWSTDLYPPGENPNPTDTITTNTIWSGGKNIYITGGIEIKSGATLTISRDTIHMPKNGIISVEAGGHLICDSCTITNSCDQCFWQGIQLKGSNTLSQTAAHQGWVTLKNGVIRDAKVGVTNYGNSGGIVQATNSSLLMIQTQ